MVKSSNTIWKNFEVKNTTKGHTPLIDGDSVGVL